MAVRRDFGSLDRQPTESHPETQLRFPNYKRILRDVNLWSSEVNAEKCASKLSKRAVSSRLTAGERLLEVQSG